MQSGHVQADDTTEDHLHVPVRLFFLEQIQGVQFYKVVAGGDGTLRAYCQATRPAALDDLDGDGSTPLPDWSALYTQFLAEHALGTVPYRWEKEHQEAILIRASIQQPFDVVVVDGSGFHDGNVSGNEKAIIIKKQLNIPPNEPLMEALGRQNKAALVRETADEWELILPHNLLPTLSLQEAPVARFQRHQRFPVTAKWQWQGDEKWQVWADDSPPALPDLSVSWIAQSLQGHAAKP